MLIGSGAKRRHYHVQFAPPGGTNFGGTFFVLLIEKRIDAAFTAARANSSKRPALSGHLNQKASL
jgi:hypothetical protein